MMPKRGWCPPKPIVCGLGASTLEHAVSGGVTHSLDNLWSSSDVIPEVQLACQKGLNAQVRSPLRAVETP
ncbi:MAG: hypothetical protein ABGX16_26015 [Pirellulales bacterium]